MISCLTRGSTVLLWTMLLAGCKGLPQSSTSLVSPLKLEELGATEDSQNLSASDECQLCIQTARTVAQEGHFNEAIKLYEKAESLSATGQTFDLELAPLYAQAGRVDASSDRYRRHLRQNGADSAASNNLAWTLLEAGRLTQAAQVSQEGLEKAPQDARLAGTLAVIRFKQGDRDAAFGILSKLHGAAAAHHNLALLELEADRIDASLSHLEAATKLPNCPEKTIELQRTLLAKLAPRPPQT